MYTFDYDHAFFFFFLIYRGKYVRSEGYVSVGVFFSCSLLVCLPFYSLHQPFISVVVG